MASTVGNMVAGRINAASAAKNAATPMHPDDARFLGALTGAFVDAGNTANPYASSGLLFASNDLVEPVAVRDVGFQDPQRYYGSDGVIHVNDGRIPFVSADSAATGLTVGVSYMGPLAGVSTASLGYSSEVDLNAAAFRSAMNAAPASSWDALTQQADARIAAGTYDRFVDLGHAITDDGPVGQRVERVWHALTYTRPDAAEQIAAFRASPNATVSRAGTGTALLRFLETQGTQPVGGLLANMAYQATGNTKYAVAVADAAGPLDALWAPRGGAAASLARVRGGEFSAAENGGINPRLTERLAAWRNYQASGGPLDLQGWVQRTQGVPWGTGFSSGYGKWISSVESVHGNSLLSPRPTTLYQLYSDDGTFLKWGISQDMNNRYSKSFMENKLITEYQSGSRSDMSRLERSMVETNPGPLNYEPWAGIRK